MSKKANPAVVGTFVLGAIVLAVAGLLIFGSGELFKERNYYVLYFDEAISGLDIGAPVEFKGVRLGTVTDIKLVYDPVTMRSAVPVTIQMEPERMTVLGEQKPAEGNLDEHIGKGMRAQLASQSMLTGKLKIMLNYFPKNEAVFRGENNIYPEVPTIPSPLRQVSQEVQELPIEEIVFEAHRAVKSIADLLSSEEAGNSLKALDATLSNIQELVSSLDARIKSMGDKLEKEADETANELQATLEAIEKLATNLDKHIEPITAEILKTSQNVSALVDVRSPIQREALRALQEVRAAARSLRSLADSLERQPESLLKGKGNE